MLTQLDTAPAGSIRNGSGNVLEYESPIDYRYEVIANADSSAATNLPVLLVTETVPAGEEQTAAARIAANLRTWREKTESVVEEQQPDVPTDGLCDDDRTIGRPAAAGAIPGTGHSGQERSGLVVRGAETYALTSLRARAADLVPCQVFQAPLKPSAFDMVAAVFRTASV